MPFVNVNGIIRRGNNTSIMTNGVWRKSTELVNANGVWRNVSFKEEIIYGNQIDGFELVYYRSKDTIYDDYPTLRNNPNLPTRFHITSESPINEFNDVEKSVIFEYSNNEPSLEGLCVYKGVLFARLKNRYSLYPISNMLDSTLSIEPDMNIYIQGYTLCEPYGPPPLGWNRLFTSENNLATEWNADKSIVPFNSYVILPSYHRSQTYDFESYIGIARNMSDRYSNMVGSHGILDHTITKIMLNGESMPFKISIFE